MKSNGGRALVETTILGKTDIEVSRLGLGLAEIRDLSGPAGTDQAAQVINGALDSGINFLDTAACYGNSEELIGNTVAHRRDEYALATKCGHSDGLSSRSWTAETVRDSIDRSLRRLKTDHLDIVQIHSCGLDVLKRGEVTEELVKARDAGKTRFIGYSGDNEDALWAVQSGIFDTLQTSLSLVDQHAATRLLEPAEAQDMGVIVKRPIGNAVWGRDSTPRPYDNAYLDRARAMAEIGPVPGAPDDPILLALGFIFAHDQVDTAIAGTLNPSHLRSNIDMVENLLPIPAEAVEELRRRYDTLGEQWRQQM